MELIHLEINQFEESFELFVLKDLKTSERIKNLTNNHFRDDVFDYEELKYILEHRIKEFIDGNNRFRISKQRLEEFTTWN
jgi:hypothetical protein